MSKLWLLKPREDRMVQAGDPWAPWYDKAFGFVVRAGDEEFARKLADENAGDENSEVRGAQSPWLNPELSSCQELTPDGEAGVVLRDFAAA